MNRLHYTGDATGNTILATGQPLAAGSMLGYDATGRPYVVRDVTYDPLMRRTTVWLEHAEPADLRRWQSELAS